MNTDRPAPPPASGGDPDASQPSGPVDAGDLPKRPEWSLLAWLGAVLAGLVPSLLSYLVMQFGSVQGSPSIVLSAFLCFGMLSVSAVSQLRKPLSAGVAGAAYLGAIISFGDSVIHPLLPPPITMIAVGAVTSALLNAVLAMFRRRTLGWVIPIVAMGLMIGIGLILEQAMVLAAASLVVSAATRFYRYFRSRRS